LRKNRVCGDERADQEVLGQGHEAGPTCRLGQRSPEDHRRQFQKTKEIKALFLFIVVLVEINFFQISAVSLSFPNHHLVRNLFNCYYQRDNKKALQKLKSK
jgi:hypothetical protein